MSGDGTTFATGAPRGGLLLGSQGSVRVYSEDPNTNTWTQRGADILGSALEEIGTRVALNYNGTVAAVSSVFSGVVRVYKYDGVSDWVLKGSAIVGETTAAQCGISIGLSDTGREVAVGCSGDSTTAAQAGRVGVYDFDGVF